MPDQSRSALSMRKITHVYSDPLDMVWIHAARQMGMRIERSDEMNASWDGQGVLTIGTPESLDSDDCLAQIILHEACHALCEGPESITKPDWGLESFNPEKKVNEHACLRLQAALADRYGLRDFFAATTVFRNYYDRIPDDPMADDGDPAVAIAAAAWEAACNGPWAEPLDSALRLTREMADLMQGVTDAGSLWHRAAPCPDP